MTLHDVQKLWKTIRKTLFGDNAKVRWENLINPVEMNHLMENPATGVKKTNETIKMVTIAR